MHGRESFEKNKFFFSKYSGLCLSIHRFNVFFLPRTGSQLFDFNYIFYQILQFMLATVASFNQQYISTAIPNDKQLISVHISVFFEFGLGCYGFLCCFWFQHFGNVLQRRQEGCLRMNNWGVEMVRHYMKTLQTYEREHIKRALDAKVFFFSTICAVKNAWIIPMLTFWRSKTTFSASHLHCKSFPSKRFYCTAKWPTYSIGRFILPFWR